MKYKVTLNQKVYEIEVEQGEAILVDVADAAMPAVQPAAAVPAAPAPAPAAAPAVAAAPSGGEVIPSPLPGNILAIKVAAGESVKKGQIVVLIEAMKMENEVLAPRDGIVAQVIVSKGSVVETGAPLLTLQ
ncbi:MAG: acetyl-CoA carboxylase biotin carboxyl carrier protein subunit [Oscillospiraceae bacterium]|jgi:glutaconyl-CoA decarboxylase|nr:acetyl-CoA carboxylase biotin carboxyl carrier protein subunit [Oscillospiraceae bacterium]